MYFASPNIKTWLQAWAYVGCFAPGGKLSFGAPIHPVHGSIDAKNELMETVA